MNRTTLSLIAAAAALAAVTGFAAATAPGDDGDSAKAAARLPVERSSLLCPAPSTSDLAETAYTSYTPVSQGSGSSGKAALSCGHARADGRHRERQGQGRQAGAVPAEAGQARRG